MITIAIAIITTIIDLYINLNKTFINLIDSINQVGLIIIIDFLLKYILSNKVIIYENTFAAKSLAALIDKY